MSACSGHAIGSRFSLLLLAAAMLAACRPEAETAPPEVRPVRTVTVVKRESGETVAFTGRIEAENETRLAFHIGGRMIELTDDPKVKATGRVREVSPQADPVTRTFEVKVGLTDAPEAHVCFALKADKIADRLAMSAQCHLPP